MPMFVRARDILRLLAFFSLPLACGRPAPAGNTPPLLRGVAPAASASSLPLASPPPLGRRSPPPSSAAVTKLVVGAHSTCARHADGTLSCWGANEEGQLGVAEPGIHPVPVRVPELDDVVDVSTDGFRTCVLRKGGEVECWGKASPTATDTAKTAMPFQGAIALAGRCARTTTRVECAASGGVVPIPRTDGAIDVAASGDDGCAVLVNGTVRCWHGSKEAVAIAGVANAVQIGLGEELACARHRDGGVSCWDWALPRRVIEISRATPRKPPVPVPVRPARVPGISGATVLSVGQGSACAANSRGVWCWERQEAPSKIPGLDAPRALAAGRHSCVAQGGRDVSCWGLATKGELGNGWKHAQPIPVRVPRLDDAVEIVGSFSPGTSGDFACARKADATVACWGNIDPIHRPNESAHAEPRAIAGLHDVQRLVRGEIVMAIDGQGRLWNAYLTPPQSMRLPEVTEATSECALARDGQVLCWSGRLRTSNDRERWDGVPVAGQADGAQLSIGTSQACLRRKSGELSCFQSHNLPPAWSVGDATSASSGTYATCLVRRDRSVWCMGAGTAAGEAASEKPTPPARIDGITDAVAVSMGGDFACALRADGTVACWGDNREGQLGDGTTTARSSARIVAGLPTITQVAAGTRFACALAVDRTVHCWGETRAGAVGTHVTDWVRAPSPVVWP